LLTSSSYVAYSHVDREVEDSSNAAKKLYDRFNALVAEGNTTGNPEFTQISSDLRKRVKAMEADLGDLDEAMAIVQGNRARFALSDEEIKKRKTFIAEKRKFTVEINGLLEKYNANKRNALTAGKNGAPLAAVGADAGGAGGGSIEERLARAQNQDNDTFLRGEVQRQNQIMRDQDQDLDELGNAVTRLSNVGNQINDELNTQNKMLEELDRDMDSTSARLKQNMRKAAKVLKDSKDKGKICVIVLLSCVLLGLLILLIKMGNF
jgi:syntaxin 6